MKLLKYGKVWPFTWTLASNKTTRSTQSTKSTDTVSVIRLLATHWGEDHAECWLPEEEQHNRFLTLIQFWTRMTPSTPLYPAEWSCISYKPICASKASYCTKKTHAHTHTDCKCTIDISHCQPQTEPQPPVFNTLSAHTHTHLLLHT